MRSLLAVFAAIVLGVTSPSLGSAHSDLQQAEPAPGASVPAPPTALRLRFSEPLDLSATRIVVTDERGARVDSGELTLGPPSDRAATVLLPDVGEGVYTVRWATLSQVDGHRWQGTYRFGVGRAPPAADEVASPFLSPPELLVRWVALVATAVVVGGLTVRTWALDPALLTHPVSRASARAATTLRLGLWLLALASVGELVAALGLLAGESPGGLGKVGALALLRLALVPMIGYLAGPSGSPGMALAFAAILVLTRAQAAHAAAYGFLSVLVDAAHQLVAAVWIGGALSIVALLPTLARSAGAAQIVLTRFARVALGAAGLALVTGFVNGWALGLDPARLLESRYGQVLAVKLALVVGLIGAAALVWRRVRLLATGSGLNFLPRPLLAELVLAAAVLLAAAAVALLPPTGETGRSTLELVRPLQRLQVHLLIESIRTGDLRAAVGLVGPDGASSAAAGQVTQVYLTPLDVLDGPGLAIEDMSTPAAGELQAGLTQIDGGGLAQSGALVRRGWWRITVGVNAGQGAMFVPFELLVPDPNRTGLDPPAAEADAERLFAQTLERMEALTAVRQRELLNDGYGTLITTTTEYVAPDRARLLTDDGEESVTVGNAQVVRRPGEQWRPARRATPLRFPLYRATYEGATGQRLGYTEPIERVRARVLTFYVPRDRAWYCWWVGLEDGLVHREVMIAPSHYMATRLDAFDRPADVRLP